MAGGAYAALGDWINDYEIATEHKDQDQVDKLDAMFDQAFTDLRIRDDLATGRVGAAELVRVTLRYGDVGTIRRTAALLDREGADTRLLSKLERELKPSSSLIPWIPTHPKRGRADRRWGVVWNDRS